LAAVAELLWVDDRADRLDLAGCDIEGEDTDQPSVGIEELGPGLTFTFTRRSSTPARTEIRHQLRSIWATFTRPNAGRLIAGASPPPRRAARLLREQSLKRLELAVLGGSEEALGEPLSKLDRGLEPGPALLDVPAGAGRRAGGRSPRSSRRSP
jgi:hypothetical protein